jgi:hypothetical protein
MAQPGLQERPVLQEKLVVVPLGHEDQQEYKGEQEYKGSRVLLD